MSTPVDNAPFRRRDEVVAAQDLPGVPVGTAGRVMYIAGVTWKRARVRFQDGTELSGLDARHLMTADEWERRRQEARVAELAAEQERRAAEARAQLALEAPGPPSH